MNNLYGITCIHVKQIVVNSVDTESVEAVNGFLQDHEGNIIDIQYVGQLYGQVAVFITYRE